jgi:hypothetical protein
MTQFNEEVDHGFCLRWSFQQNNDWPKVLKRTQRKIYMRTVGCKKIGKRKFS